MIVIADSGSTKTDWRIISSHHKIQKAQSLGFNPNYDSGDFTNSIQKNILPYIPDIVTKVYFYGAGCSTEKNKAISSQVLQPFFPEATLYIEHDILAAARALCGHQSGIACILGTGSNACFYDGQFTLHQDLNFGYLIGDEGSGFHLGKSLLTAYIHKELPQELLEKFARRYPDTNRVSILDHLYHQPYPNRYLASFAKFLFDHQQHPTIYRMIYNCFVTFFDKYILTLENHTQHTVHFVGSIAFYFSNILRQVANDKNIRTGNILETPIAGLTLYHHQQLS